MYEGCTRREWDRWRIPVWVDPIGRMVATGSGGWARVIGVAENSAEADLVSGEVPARYMLVSHVPATRLQQSVVLVVIAGAVVWFSMGEDRR